MSFIDCFVLNLTKKLIECPSISPNDAGCQDILSSYLYDMGFVIEKMPFYTTKNLWAYRNGKNNGKTFIFSGHTDVVPAGDIKLWKSHPFKPVCRNGFLYGRGSSDMKGSLSSMVTATLNFFKHYSSFPGRIAFLITSDEEGAAKNGTKKVIKELISRREKLDFCIIGEPSSKFILGDVVKNGRRGSMAAHITIMGVNRHIAYTSSIENILHKTTSFLNELISIDWRKQNDNNMLPPTVLQVIDFKTYGGSSNVTPNKLLLKLNFRFNSSVHEKLIKKKVEKLMIKYQLNYQIRWNLSGKPFFISKNCELASIVTRSISDFNKTISTKFETSGGTSDGRFICSTGAQIMELGLPNQSMHQVNENVKITDLFLLTKIYQRIMEYIFFS